MNIKLIETVQDYNDTLNRIDTLMDSIPNAKKLIN